MKPAAQVVRVQRRQAAAAVDAGRLLQQPAQRPARLQPVHQRRRRRPEPVEQVDNDAVRDLLGADRHQRRQSKQQPSGSGESGNSHCKEPVKARAPPRPSSHIGPAHPRLQAAAG